MAEKIFLDRAYVASEEVVVRVIEGEILIVPLTAGIGDFEDALYTLNQTGRALWDLLDGKTVLKDVVRRLSSRFEASADEIERDVLGLVAELYNRRILVEAPHS